MSLRYRVGDITELNVHWRALWQMRQRYGALLLAIGAATVVLNLGCQPMIVLVVAVAVEFAVAKIVLRSVKRGEGGNKSLINQRESRTRPRIT